MKHITLILLIIFITTSHLTYGQLVRDHEVNESSIKPWIETNIENYEARYIFQPNDGNFLILIIDDTNIVAQIHFPAHWTEGGYGLELGFADSSEFKFHSEYITLTGVDITNGKFYSDQYLGEFITFISDSITYEGIKIYNSWNLSYWPEYKYEIGVRRKDKQSEYIYGNYIEASTKILDSTYLSKFSKKELKIMRNEIYARYHYSFKDDGEMYKYFSEQEWFTITPANYKSVNHMLTWIELKNIELIKKIELLK